MNCRYRYSGLEGRAHLRIGIVIVCDDQGTQMQGSRSLPRSSGLLQQGSSDLRGVRCFQAHCFRQQPKNSRYFKHAAGTVRCQGKQVKAAAVSFVPYNKAIVCFFKMPCTSFCMSSRCPAIIPRDFRWKRKSTHVCLRWSSGDRRSVCRLKYALQLHSACCPSHATSSKKADMYMICLNVHTSSKKADMYMICLNVHRWLT